MKFVQKFMQPGRSQLKYHFQQLDAEPRPAAGYTSSIFPGGPPPSYRSSTNADDSSTFSSTESSSGAATTVSTTIKRRNSWANLIESDENLYRKDFPCYYAPSPCTTAATTTATTTTTMTDGSTIGTVALPYYRPPVPTVYENRYQSLEKYNLNGRYAKHFTPFYLLNSAGDPIAISKLELNTCDWPYKLNGAEPPTPNRLKRDRMTDLRQWSREPKNKFCSFLICLLTIASCMTVIVLLSSSQLMETQKFSWIPPIAFRNGQKNPTTIKMYQNEHQVRFEIIGNLPIKNNYVSVYDFRTRKLAIIDSTLRNSGKNLVCFVMNMNTSTMPDKYALEIGAQNAFKRKEQTQGWEETWNFVPGSFFGNTSTLFDPPVPECDGARWILLNYTKYDQRGQKCSDCYDFCLPELGLQRDRLRAETFLNIVRRDCFYLFVPEWRSFATAHSNEQNQRDFEQFYHGDGSRNGVANNNGGGTFGNGFSAIQNAVGDIVQPITDQYRNFESKWISLQQVPQHLSNLTSQAMDQVSNIASNVQNSLSNAAQNIFKNQQQQQLSGVGNGRNGYNSNFNFNNNNGFDNGGPQNGNTFLNENIGLNAKPLLPMPPPSYPAVQIANKQQQPSSNSYPGGILQSYQQNAGNGNGNGRQFAGSNGNGQLILSSNYGAQPPNAYNPQLSLSGQPSPNILPNTLHVNGQSNQPQSIYDTHPSYGGFTAGQSNNYTPQPAVGGAYMQQTTGGAKQQNDQNSGGVSQQNQQSTNDQGWITVG